MNTFTTLIIFNCFVFFICLLLCHNSTSLPVIQISPYILMHLVIYKCHSLGRLLPRSNPARQYRQPGRQETFKSQCGLNRQPWLNHSKGCFPREGGRFSATSQEQVNFPPFTKTTCCHTHTVVILPEQIQGRPHKCNSFEENALRLSKKPRHTLHKHSKCKTYVHHAHLFLW